MPFYHKSGELPRVKHTTFYKPDGTSLYREELISSKGFSGVYSNLYHHHMPTAISQSKEIKAGKDVNWPEVELLYYHFFTEDKKSGGDFIGSRDLYLHNAQCKIYTAKVTKATDRFYRNALGAEFIFIHRGSGYLQSPYGKNPFGPGDQIVIPRTTTYQMVFDNYDDNKLLIVESDTAFDIPKHYKNEYGQMEEHAPYCERDFRPPEFSEAIDEKGEFIIIVKAKEKFFEHSTPTHPFDVVGWDGFLYPFTFNIHDYHAKVGRIHLPPPVHLLYVTGGFIICNFVPRPYDFHKDAIPAPYFHSNIDSDEVLYYCGGDFMSRKGIKDGSITIHPGGMPHGPQPGRTEASVGAAETNELAVMIDTYQPLTPTKNVKDTMDNNYAQSWIE